MDIENGVAINRIIEVLDRYAPYLKITDLDETMLTISLEPAGVEIALLNGETYEGVFAFFTVEELIENVVIPYVAILNVESQAHIARAIMLMMLEGGNGNLAYKKIEKN